MRSEVCCVVSAGELLAEQLKMARSVAVVFVAMVRARSHRQTDTHTEREGGGGGGGGGGRGTQRAGKMGWQERI